MNTKEEKGSIRFAIFADLHYKKGLYASTVEDLNTILRRAYQNGAEFVIHAGDFSNDYLHSPEITKAYLNNPYNLPVYGVYGNHELEGKENSMSIVTPLLNNREVVWGTKDGKIGDGSIAYFYTDIRNFRLICLDTNYSQNPDTYEWEHNATESYGPPLGNLNEDSIDPTQTAWLDKVVTDAANTQKSCIVVSHSSFSGLWKSSPSSDDVRAIFRKANAIRKGTVLLAANGHLHTNHADVREDVAYFDVNTVRNTLWVPKELAFSHYDGVVCPIMDYDEQGNELALRDVEISNLRMAKNTWFSTEPLSAIVTVKADGKVEIEGESGTYLAGIAPTFELGDEVGPQILSTTLYI